MSLTSSLSNALSGLTATSRAAHLVSSNLANAMNENYSRQELELGGLQGGGVAVSSVNRFVDTALLADKRNAQSGLELSTERARNANAIEATIGSPDDPSSLSAHLNRFDAALQYLESDPNSDVRLRDVLSSASALSQRLNSAESNIQSERVNADRQIALEVESLNSNLQQIALLNEQIVNSNVNGRDANMLLDERQNLIDQVSELVPVREMPRERGAVSLVSANGMMLLESSAVSFDFTRVNHIVPQMSVEGGQLSSLTIDGEDLDMSKDSGRLAGGRLQALFEVRDNLVPEAQERIDVFALDLAERFHDLPNDLGAGIGAPGLFTDNGALAEAANQVGLAGRLEIHPGVDPDQGGELWRLRSGMDAASPAAAGYTSFVTDMISSLSALSPTHGSIFEHGASLISAAAQASSDSTLSQSFASARYEQLNLMQLQHGVDTDSELQKLLSIETNYAANAKVIQAVEEMLSAIMRIN